MPWRSTWREPWQLMSNLTCQFMGMRSRLKVAKITSDRIMETRKIQQHPYGKELPHLNHNDLSSLTKSIRAHGLREPITLYEGKILDGWNRYSACIGSGVKPTFVEFEGDDPIQFVIDRNIERRHLDDYQKIEIVKKLAGIEIALAAKERQKSKPGRKVSRAPKGADEKVKPNRRTDEIAAHAKVSRRQVEKFEKVDRDGAPEVKRAVKQGTMSLGEAAEIARLPIVTQKNIAKLPKTERVARVKEALSPAKIVSEDWALETLKSTWLTSSADTKADFLQWLKTIHPFLTVKIPVK